MFYSMSDKIGERLFVAKGLENAGLNGNPAYVKFLETTRSALIKYTLAEKQRQLYLVISKS